MLPLESAHRSYKHAQWERAGQWAPGQKEICQADVAFVSLIIPQRFQIKLTEGRGPGWRGNFLLPVQ